MKTTLITRQIANPRRTTLAHLKDVSELAAVPVGADVNTAATSDTAAAPDAAEEAARIAAATRPQRTANPRRTVLNELPKSRVTS
jgi:hypothetical protein